VSKRVRRAPQADNVPQADAPPFKAGDRIELVEMTDPFPIAPGERGTVRRLEKLLGSYQVDVAWDCGRTLYLVVPPDVARVV
jgi:hypothetical protein